MKTTQDLLQYIEDNCKPVDREERFNAMLDECYNFSKVGGPFEHMLPSQVLLECDPVAHRCGVNDYMDGEDVTEVLGETYDDSDIEEARSEFVDELNDELRELENELETLEGEEDTQERDDDISSKKCEIAALEKLIAECEAYAF